MKITQSTYNIINSPLNKSKVLVVGDVMLDRYWFSDVTRISPEAPIPIAKINKIEDRPGGAANVARNIADLGGNVTLLSVVGTDEASHKLTSLLQKENINLLFKEDESISTIIKIRVISRNQQLIRLDFEDLPSHEILSEALDTYTQIIDQYDVIILSDYGKGGLNHAQKMIDIANKHNKLILVDPKGNDYSKYHKATLITPNKSELREVVGSWATESELYQKAHKLLQEIELEHILLTRSEEGVTLFNQKDGAISYPTHAKEVYDVSGAGDTIIGVLALMIANNVDITQAIQVANMAAGIVVGKLGTATISKQELIHEINLLRTQI